MNDLIQRLTQTTQFHENADVTTKEVVGELEKQQAEIEELRAKILAIACVQVDREEVLKAQAVKDAADAGRYRWLRDCKIHEHINNNVYDCVTQALDRDCLSLDEAIDKAMKESQA